MVNKTGYLTSEYVDSRIKRISFPRDWSDMKEEISRRLESLDPNKTYSPDHIRKVLSGL